MRTGGIRRGLRCTTWMGGWLNCEEPYSAGGFNYETEHFCELVREGRRESPVIPHAMSVEMARLLEEARRELGVRFGGGVRWELELVLLRRL